MDEGRGIDFHSSTVPTYLTSRPPSAFLPLPLLCHPLPVSFLSSHFASLDLFLVFECDGPERGIA